MTQAILLVGLADAISGLSFQPKVSLVIEVLFQSKTVQVTIPERMIPEPWIWQRGGECCLNVAATQSNELYYEVRLWKCSNAFQVTSPLPLLSPFCLYWMRWGKSWKSTLPPTFFAVINTHLYEASAHYILDQSLMLWEVNFPRQMYPNEGQGLILSCFYWEKVWFRHRLFIKLSSPNLELDWVLLG